MAHAGETLDIAVAGRIVFRKTAEDTNGELLEFDYFLPAHKVTGGEHLHPTQVERFSVVKGQVKGKVGGEERVASAGEVVEMPAGTWHHWWNDGDEEAQLHVEVRPALRTEQFYEVMAEIDVNDRGMPSPIHGAVVMREYLPEQRLKRMDNPIIGGGVMRILAAIGKRRGYSPRPGESRHGNGA